MIFEWSSKQACRHCLKKETGKVSTKCGEDNNQRDVTHITSEDCIIKGESLIDDINNSRQNVDTDILKKTLVTKEVYYEECSHIEDFFRNKTGLIIVIFVIVVIIFALMIGFFI